MSDGDVILPGAGGHINGSNSAAMQARKRKESLTQGFPCDTCGSEEAMATIFGEKRYRNAVYRSYKEDEYSSIKEVAQKTKKSCGSSCDCEECKTKFKSYSEAGRYGSVPDVTTLLWAAGVWEQQN
jgi:DNA-directed RNA polymerase subunit M/transcription elongation factor TFIIS